MNAAQVVECAVSPPKRTCLPLHNIFSDNAPAGRLTEYMQKEQSVATGGQEPDRLFMATLNHRMDGNWSLVIHDAGKL